jgi:membrane fusion protein (multidrug efflux system)
MLSRYNDESERAVGGRADRGTGPRAPGVDMQPRGAFLLLLILLPAFTGCSSEVAGASRDGQVDGEQEPPSASAVRTVRVARPIPVGAQTAFPSSLYIERDVRLTARNSGVFEKILAERGDRVSRGQVLAVLETDLHTRQVEMAEQRLRLAEAMHEQARSLHEGEVVSSIEKLTREIDRDLAASELEVARAWLERCNIRAPFDGVIVERWVAEGQRVVEDDTTPIFRVIADDPLRARIHLPEPRLAEIAVGDPVRVELTAGTSLPAKVIFISPAIDAASGTGAVIVEVEAQHDAARVGASVAIRLADAEIATARLLRVPRGALARGPLVEGELASLFVATSGLAEQRDVEVVDIFGSHVTISGGVALHDQVILTSGPDLQPGEAVRIEGRP